MKHLPQFFALVQGDVPNLWLRRGGFGVCQRASSCGAVDASSDEVRQAMREARRGEPLVPAMTLEEARADLAAYVICPAFYEGEGADLAAEYLQEIHHVEAASSPALWACYAAAARSMGFAGEVPVPVLSGAEARS